MYKAELLKNRLYIIMELCEHSLADEFDNAIKNNKIFKEFAIK